MDTTVKHCPTCNELTPQTVQTVGFCCHVCFNQNNNYSAVPVVDAEWRAQFWQRKFFELKKAMGGFGITITGAGTGAVRIVEGSIGSAIANNYKTTARTAGYGSAPVVISIQPYPNPIEKTDN